MNSFQAGVIGCRLLALYVLFHVLTLIPLFPLVALSASQAEQRGLPGSSPGSSHIGLLVLLSDLLPFLLLSAFAAFLWLKAIWLKAIWLAERMAVAAAPLEGTAVTPDSRLQRMILTMIAVFILVTVIPDAAHAIATALLTPEDVAQSAGNMAQVAAGNWSLLLRFLIGFTLLFAAPAISNGLDKLHQ